MVLPAAQNSSPVAGYTSLGSPYPAEKFRGRAFLEGATSLRNSCLASGSRGSGLLRRPYVYGVARFHFESSGKWQC